MRRATIAILAVAALVLLPLLHKLVVVANLGGSVARENLESRVAATEAFVSRLAGEVEASVRDDRGSALAEEKISRDVADLKAALKAAIADTRRETAAARRAAEAAEAAARDAATLRGTAARAAAATTASSPRHLVMSCAAGNYGLGQFKNFVLPLRKLGAYAGDVALFVLNVDAKSRAWLAGEKVDLVFVELAKCVKLQGNCATDKIWGDGIPVGLQRFRYYLDYVRAHPGYDLVLWSDFRDAFFQRNPFDDFRGDARGKDLLFFGEHTVRPLSATSGKGLFTRAWVEGCYGKVLTPDVTPEGAPVLCSGNVMGTGAAVLAYLEAYLANVDAQDGRANWHCWRDYGIDQGHHNYMAYVKYPKHKFAVAPYDAGPAYTAGQVMHVPEDLKRDAAGYVLRADGRRAALVHQYDRHPVLSRFYGTVVRDLQKA